MLYPAELRGRVSVAEEICSAPVLARRDNGELSLFCPCPAKSSFRAASFRSPGARPSGAPTMRQPTFRARGLGAYLTGFAALTEQARRERRCAVPSRRLPARFCRRSTPHFLTLLRAREATEKRRSRSGRAGKIRLHVRLLAGAVAVTATPLTVTRRQKPCGR